MYASVCTVSVNGLEQSWSHLGCLFQVISTSPLELTELQARLYGGVVCETLDEAVTHVVVHKRFAYEG